MLHNHICAMIICDISYVCVCCSIAV